MNSPFAPTRAVLPADTAVGIATEPLPELATDIPAAPSLNRPRPRKWYTFAGAGALIAVGYMDPGNWATDLAAGSHYGYTLLCVVLLASVMAMLLQWLASRVGLITGRDIAELCRARFQRRTVLLLWLASEIAIIACDVAEVVGSAVALQLLFGVSLTLGVLLSAVGTLALLGLRQLGPRAIEIAVAALILFVAICLVAQLALARPDWPAVFSGFVPARRIATDVGLLWLSAGILGATVMPHNLFLHSTLVKKYAVPGRLPSSLDEIANVRTALKGVGIDTAASLTLAFVINAALLIVAAAVFNAAGHTNVDDLADAHRLLTPLLGTRWGALLFAGALLACGLNSTVTGTLAGQAVMEGFLRLRISPWRRMLLTRSLALVPALIAVILYGDKGTTGLLVASQVVLSIQLPMVVIPLVAFASNRTLMGRWHISGAVRGISWACAGAILTLNGLLAWQALAG